MALTREFLEQQGLEVDVITAVMREHGKTINPLNEQIEQLNTTNTQQATQIAERDTQLAELKDSGDDKQKVRITELEADNEALKQQHADELNATIKAHKIELLANEIGTADVDWAKDKLSALELKDGELDGSEELIKGLKEKHPSLFVSEPNEPAKPKAWSQGGVSTVSNGELSRADIMKVEDITKRQQLIKEHSHLF